MEDQISILFDVYHQQIQEGNLIPNIDASWEEIGYFQMGDNPGRKEPTTGEINYKNIFKHRKAPLCGRRPTKHNWKYWVNPVVYKSTKSHIFMCIKYSFRSDVVPTYTGRNNDFDLHTFYIIHENLHLFQKGQSASCCFFYLCEPRLPFLQKM